MDYSFIDLIWKLLTDAQTGFFFYTLVYFVFRVAKGKQRMRPFDQSARIAICVLSAVFLVFWMGTVVYAWNLSEENQTHMQNRMTGPYALGYWLPMVLYFLLPQLLWIPKVNENYISRFLIAFFLFFNFEKFVIIATSLHRDYLPSTWTMFPETDFGSMLSDSHLFWIIFGILWKFALFTGLAALLFSIRRKKDNFAT